MLQSLYCTLQIIQGGKILQYAKLNCNSLEIICGWTMALYGQKPIAQAISLEKFHGYQSVSENRKTFPPRTICNVQYKQFSDIDYLKK